MSKQRYLPAISDKPPLTMLGLLKVYVEYYQRAWMKFQAEVEKWKKEKQL